MTPQEEMRNEFYALYERMSNSKNVSYMHVFGQVHKEMMEWMIANKPSEAQEWIEKLSSIKWDNYLTKQEADRIVQGMEPKAPWSREQWSSAMEQHGFALEDSPCYNRCALYVTMSMIYTDSVDTLTKYVEKEKLFGVIHDLAVDKLTDADGYFDVRQYFGL